VHSFFVRYTIIGSYVRLHGIAQQRLRHLKSYTKNKSYFIIFMVISGKQKNRKCYGKIILKKTTLQSALVTSSRIIYLSFDHNVLNKEETVFKKWMLIEGLLKTILSSNISITHVQFLVQHQQLHDAHLDFSVPWPVHGFMHDEI
jgi:hypothetical protein